MAKFLRQNWLWLLWAIGMALPLMVRPTSKWMAGVEILPLMAATILMVVRNYKSVMADKRRGNAKGP
jgi:hypothetical protein